MVSILTLNASVGDLQRDYIYKTAVVKNPLGLPNYSIPSVLTKSSLGIIQPDPMTGELPGGKASLGLAQNTPADAEHLDLLNTKGIFPERVTQQIEQYWGGEKVYFGGRDESNKKGTLVFRCPESMGIKDYWEACKDLTGTLGNHAAVPKALAVMDIDVYLVATSKDTITEFRGLRDVQVWSVKDLSPDKEGSGILTFSVDITWDKVVRDYNIRGNAI